jgi:hypothetical protein
MLYITPSEHINGSFTPLISRLSFSVELAIVCFHLDTQDADKEDQVTEPLVLSPFPP